MSQFSRKKKREKVTERRTERREGGNERKEERERESVREVHFRNSSLQSPVTSEDGDMKCEVPT
jgi:hypothetical protein